MPPLRVQTSRRPKGLKDSDYDHEISLVDRDSQAEPKTRPTSSRPETDDGGEGSLTAPGPAGSSAEPARPAETAAEASEEHSPAQLQSLGQPQDNVDQRDHFQDARETQSARPSRDEPRREPDTQSDNDDECRDEGDQLQVQDTAHTGISIEIEGPTPFEQPADAVETNGSFERPKSKQHEERETAIDLLWENERGCILCGAALFSGAALGSLDPSPWTNKFKKTSPTTVKTAQVPDPSWEWAWPEWRVHREEGVLLDDAGWEYSFMFHKKFSWHGPKWWNSFVRRRVWVRKRVKKNPDDISTDPHMLNTDYFTITPARSRSVSVRSSVAGSQASVNSDNSKPSMTQFSKGESILEENMDIEDIWMLLSVLRAARIDREKIEAVENYLKNTQDELEGLDREMHEIMSLFVFQASRRILLSRLNQMNDDINRLDGQDAAGSLSTKRQHLGAAIKHADEEVKRLSYWSDVKRVVEAGESEGAAEEEEECNEEERRGTRRSTSNTDTGKGKLP